MTQITLSNEAEVQAVEVTQQDAVQALSVEQVEDAQEVAVNPDVTFLRGFSPTIEVEAVMGGFDVTITDVDHAETIFIASGGEVDEQAIKEAVNAYLEENPVQSGATAEQVAQIERNAADIAELALSLADRYTKAETDEAISAAVEGIDIPEVDLTGYYTKGETDTAIKTAVDGIEIPETDLSDYYTKSEVNAQIAAIPTPDVSGQINTHNVATDAHNDIRLLVQGLDARLTALADSDDTTLDQLSEIVAYIKDNRELIESVTTTKVNVSDIIDNLTTNVGDKPLSAAQGVALKALIDAIEIPTVPTNVSAFENDAGYLTEHQDLSNYYLKAEVDTAIEEAVGEIGAPDMSNYALADHTHDAATESAAGFMSTSQASKLAGLKGIKSEIVVLKDVTLTKGALLEDQIITFPTQHCNADNYICKFFISSWPKATWTDAFVFNVHSDCTIAIGNPGTLFAYNQFGLATMATQKYDLIAQFIYYDE